MKSTNNYAIHSYISSSQTEWFQWMKEQFKNSPVKIDSPSTPDSGDPHLESKLKHLRKNIFDTGEITIFISHSFGCIMALSLFLKNT